MDARGFFIYLAIMLVFLVLMMVVAKPYLDNLQPVITRKKFYVAFAMHFILSCPVVVIVVVSGVEMAENSLLELGSSAFVWAVLSMCFAAYVSWYCRRFSGSER